MTIVPEESRLQILHFYVQKTYLCLELKFIQQVLPLTALKAIPTDEDYLVGLLNLAGNGITVIDLATRLGLERENNYTLNTPMLLCSDGQETTGFIIDEILGIEEIERQAIQQRLEFNKPSSFFSGAVSIENKIALLVNIHMLMLEAEHG